MDFSECPVEILQNPDEFPVLLQRFRELKPASVLEIGSLFGGTLWYWIHNVGPGSTVVSIDRMIVDTDPRWDRQDLGHRQLWHEWAEECRVALISFDGESRDPLIRNPILRLVGSFDFLFIDGSHKTEDARFDFEVYGSLVRKGGMIAFHDIVAPQGTGHYGVAPLWQELKAKHRTEEVDGGSNQGIGILYVE